MSDYHHFSQSPAIFQFTFYRKKMRFITTICVLFFAVVAVASGAKKVTLDDFYDEVLDQMSRINYNQHIQRTFRDIKDDCLENSTKVNLNGHKMISYAQGTILMVSAIDNCIKSDKNKFWRETLKEFVNKVTGSSWPMNCYEHGLSKLEPNSTLLKDYHGDVTLEDCWSERRHNRLITDLEEMTGDVSIFTCGAISVNDFLAFMMKALILHKTEDGDFKVAEQNKFIDELRDKLQVIHKCVMKEIEKPRRAGRRRTTRYSRRGHSSENSLY